MGAIERRILAAMRRQKDRSSEVPRAGLRKRLFARWYDTVMAKYERYIGQRKEALFATLPSTVMEIGPGTGANLVYLSPGSTWIGIEPNPYMHAPLRDKAAALGLDVELRVGAAEAIDAKDGSVDALVGTLVLCSVPDSERALAEIRRVLKPGGKFYFIEHVAAPRGTWLRRWQRAIRPIWICFADGCHPDRETGAAIRSAGFQSVEQEEFRIPFPPALPLVSPHIQGVAVK